MSREWSDIYCHPLWAISTVILAIILRAQRKGSWDPRACPVSLNGKTVIVTGANTGKKLALSFENGVIYKGLHYKVYNKSLIIFFKCALRNVFTH